MSGKILFFHFVAVKFLQRTREAESNSVEILRDLDHIEMAAVQMEQHLGEIIAYVEEVIVSCINLRCCVQWKIVWVFMS